MSNNKDEDQGRTAGRLSLMHDLYVDLLGSLVPGLLTVILGGAAIVLGLSTLHTALFRVPMLPADLQGGIREVLTGFHWEFATVLIVSAYVIGAVFFRQDPKRPDAASALHVWMNSKARERSGLAVQSARPLSTGLTLSDAEDRPAFSERLWAYLRPAKHIRLLGLNTQFPYPHLRCYLAARGLAHLTRLVPWCPNERETDGFRTKMFINILKIRLLSLLPNLSRDIIRNEAHVRLATSVWYASTALLYMAAVVLVLLAVISIACVRAGMGSTLFVSTSFSLLLLLFCLAMRHHLRKCIHYMRVREVVYVLETAHLAERIKGSDFLADLIEKDMSNKCVQCDQMKPLASSGA